MAFGSAEILLIGALTIALVVYCARDAARRPRADGMVSSGTWVVLLTIGAVIWPIGWVASAAYLATRPSAAAS